LFVQNDAGRDRNGRAASLYAAYDDADRGRIRFWIKRGDPQVPEASFERGKELRQRFRSVNDGAGARWLGGGGEKANPRFEAAVGHGPRSCVALIFGWP
jgi:hypothetical protein